MVRQGVWRQEIAVLSQSFRNWAAEMRETMEKAAVRLRKGSGRSVKSGGAWVYDNEIDFISGSYENGGLVTV